MTRGRKRGIENIENEILKILSDQESEMGFRQIHSKLKTCSKTTLSNSLKLLIVQHKIIQKDNRKYVINREVDILVNVKRLNHILKNLTNFFPTLKKKEEALLGIKLWTLVFQTEFHPASYFFGKESIPISYDTTNSKRIKAIRDFFETKNYVSMFQDRMFDVFFEFCSKFSSQALESVFNETLYSPLSNLASKKKSYYDLVSSIQSLVSVSTMDHTIYYGTAFCNLLYSIKPGEFNKNNIEKIRKDLEKYQISISKS